MKKKYIDEGRCGTCYELPNGDVLKVFKIPKDKSEIKKYEHFKNYKNDSIIFPHMLIVQGSKFKGYVTKKVDGEPLDISLMRYNIEDIYNHVISLEKNIDFISQGSIKMLDVHSKNVFYNGKKISVFDPDFYQISSINSDDLFYINIREVKELILEIINIEIKKTSLKDKKSLYNELRKYFMNDYEINYMILEYKKLLEEYYQRNILKFKDIGDDNGNMHSRTYRRG